MVYVVHVFPKDRWVMVLGSKKEAMRRARDILSSGQRDGRVRVKYIDNAKLKRTEPSEFPTSVVVERRYSYYNGA